ncbi:hypothetical protein GCM10011323_06100 [Pontibacter amylolyticus]|uniref:Transposase DDE domain-containing protein n=1 Tax=Pontibacter amylolyticus TaxID=1424080 RepID=A0ABQ1VYN8_9BACT|nr:hypothetical protein GCM10011323_06100 [Pontibacter amylolyticus]
MCTEGVVLQQRKAGLPQTAGKVPVPEKGHLLAQLGFGGSHLLKPGIIEQYETLLTLALSLLAHLGILRIGLRVCFSACKRYLQGGRLTRRMKQFTNGLFDTRACLIRPERYTEARPPVEVL